MNVYSFHTKKKKEECEDVPTKASFTYERDGASAVKFRYDGIELLDICLIRKILTEAEDDMLSPEPTPGSEPRAM